MLPKCLRGCQKETSGKTIWKTDLASPIRVRILCTERINANKQDFKTDVKFSSERRNEQTKGKTYKKEKKGVLIAFARFLYPTPTPPKKHSKYKYSATQWSVGQSLMPERP